MAVQSSWYRPPFRFLIKSYFNLNKVYTQGFESTFNFKTTEKLNIVFGYQFLEAKDKDIVESIENGQIFARKSSNSPSFVLKSKDYIGLYNRSKHIWRWFFPIQSQYCRSLPDIKYLFSTRCCWAPD